MRCCGRVVTVDPAYFFWGLVLTSLNLKAWVALFEFHTSVPFLPKPGITGRGKAIYVALNSVLLPSHGISPCGLWPYGHSLHVFFCKFIILNLKACMTWFEPLHHECISCRDKLWVAGEGRGYILYVKFNTVAGQGVPSCGLWSVGHSLHVPFFFANLL